MAGIGTGAAPLASFDMAALDALAPDARSLLLSVMHRMAMADGSLDLEEAEALRGAAIALGVGELSAIARDRVSPLPPDTLTDRDRMLVFVGAAWLMLADGVRARGESRYLERLADDLGLSDETARFLSAHARWIRTEADLPWHREFDWLITEAARRIHLVQSRRAAA